MKETVGIAGKEARMCLLRKYVEILVHNIVYKGHYIEE
jgi:hypothetical protein